MAKFFYVLLTLINLTLFAELFISSAAAVGACGMVRWEVYRAGSQRQRNGGEIVSENPPQSCVGAVAAHDAVARGLAH
jgi:hypothetical protein